MVSIEQVFPPDVRRDVADSIEEGPLILAARPGAGAAKLATALASDTVVLRPREAGTPLGFRMLFARALVEWAATQTSRAQAGTSRQPPVMAVLAQEFGRLARDVAAFANGDVEHDIAFAELARRLPERIVVVVDEAHLLDAVAGREVLWGLRDHRHVVLVTRPWFVDGLRHPDAAFFGHGRTLDLFSVEPRPPLENPGDVAFVAERAMGSAELVAEILNRGDGDVRRGWSDAVEARRTVTASFLSAGFAIHQFGPGLLNAIAADDAPYAAIPDGSTARIANALRALRDHDFIYPPRPRRWRLADPAMAAALRGSAA